jgi:hypothetical protein
VQSLEIQKECYGASYIACMEGFTMYKSSEVRKVIVRELLGDLDIDGKVILTEIFDEVCC